MGPWLSNPQKVNPKLVSNKLKGSNFYPEIAHFFRLRVVALMMRRVNSLTEFEGWVGEGLLRADYNTLKLGNTYRGQAEISEIRRWKSGPAGVGIFVCLVYAVYHRGISGYFYLVISNSSSLFQYFSELRQWKKMTLSFVNTSDWFNYVIVTSNSHFNCFSSGKQASSSQNY